MYFADNKSAHLRVPFRLQGLQIGLTASLSDTSALTSLCGVLHDHPPPSVESTGSGGTVERAFEGTSLNQALKAVVVRTVAAGAAAEAPNHIRLDVISETPCTDGPNRWEKVFSLLHFELSGVGVVFVKSSESSECC